MTLLDEMRELARVTGADTIYVVSGRVGGHFVSAFDPASDFAPYFMYPDADQAAAAARQLEDDGVKSVINAYPSGAWE